MRWFQALSWPQIDLEPTGSIGTLADLYRLKRLRFQDICKLPMSINFPGKHHLKILSHWICVSLSTKFCAQAFQNASAAWVICSVLTNVDLFVIAASRGQSRAEQCALNRTNMTALQELFQACITCDFTDCAPCEAENEVLLQLN